MKLLMHACCAPCSVYCIDELRKENIEPTIYWYNPNIHPYKEYESRRDCLIEYTKSININYIVEDEYGLDEFCKNVSNNLESRCVDYCYPIRMRKTFEYAKENGYDAVTTTLLYSIYQKHDYIKLLCEKLSKEFGIKFLYRDFRYGFWEGHEKAKATGLYMQKYCGCIFSEEDRYLKKKKDALSLPEGIKSRKGENMKKYKVGMYGGKFMPFHKGHLYCVEQAAKLCEKLYVILFTGGTQELEILKTRHEEWLQPDDRAKHMKEACKRFKNVEAIVIDTSKCKNPDGTEDWDAETPLVLKACGKLDAVFGSEPDYDDYFKRAYPGAEYVQIDVERDVVPISATMIRNMESEEERKKWII